jgi:hypothetical protein
MLNYLRENLLFKISLSNFEPSLASEEDIRQNQILTCVILHIHLNIPESLHDSSTFPGYLHMSIDIAL